MIVRVDLILQNWSKVKKSPGAYQLQLEIIATGSILEAY